MEGSAKDILEDVKPKEKKREYVAIDMLKKITGSKECTANGYLILISPLIYLAKGYSSALKTI